MKQDRGRETQRQRVRQTKTHTHTEREKERMGVGQWWNDRHKNEFKGPGKYYTTDIQEKDHPRNPPSIFTV